MQVIINVYDTVGGRDLERTPRLTGYTWLVVQDLSNLSNGAEAYEHYEQFNCYAGRFALLATCVSREAAEAAKRLLSL